MPFDTFIQEAKELLTSTKILDELFQGEKVNIGFAVLLRQSYLDEVGWPADMKDKTQEPVGDKKVSDLCGQSGRAQGIS